MQPWHAELTLRFEQRTQPNSCTVLAYNRHTGPLRVQKALYPEGNGICHAVLLHPPAGVAASDQLRIAIDVAAHAHALITTPGATQWYKSTPSQPAALHTHLTVAAGGHLDYLPQENILFDHSHAQLHTRVDLQRGASIMGWDAIVLGRSASGEQWLDASLLQHTTFALDDNTLWLENGLLDSESPLRNNTLGLANHRIMATLWMFGGDSTAERVQSYAETLPYHANLKAGFTYIATADSERTGGLCLLRILGDDMQAVRQLLTQAWLDWRSVIHGAAGVPLRLWQT